MVRLTRLTTLLGLVVLWWPGAAAAFSAADLAAIFTACQTTANATHPGARSSPIHRSIDQTTRSSGDGRVVIPTHRQAGPRYIAMKRARSDSKVFRLSPSRVVFNRWSEPDRQAS